MEKPTIVDPTPEENIPKNTNNILDEDEVEIGDESNEQKSESPYFFNGLTPEEQKAMIKRDMGVLKEIITLLSFGPLESQEIAALYSQYTGQNLRKKTKVPIKEFLRGYNTIFQFFIQHKVVEDDEAKKKQKLELVGVNMDHEIVTQVLAEPARNDQAPDYSYITNVVCVQTFFTSFQVRSKIIDIESRLGKLQVN